MLVFDIASKADPIADTSLRSMLRWPNRREGSKLFSGVQSIADRIDMLQRVRNIANTLKIYETSFANTEHSDTLIVCKVQSFERITPKPS